MAEGPLYRSDFQRLFERGNYLAGDLLAMRYLKRDDGGRTRFGFVIPRRIGGAVARNRLRRRLKAILADLPLSGGFDCLWLVRNDVPPGHEALQTEVKGLLEKSGALSETVSR